MKKNIFIIVLLLAVAILGWMFFSGWGRTKVDTTQTEQLKNEYAALQDSLASHQTRDALKVSVIISQDSTIRAIRAGNEVTRKELDKTKTVARQLAKEIKELQPEDTSVYAHKVDSLVSQNQNLIWLNDQYVDAVDSLNKVVDQQKATYEQRISDQVALNSQMRTFIDQGKTAYDGLAKDNKSLVKQVRREKIKTKVAAGIALAAIVKGFFHK